MAFVFFASVEDRFVKLVIWMTFRFIATNAIAVAMWLYVSVTLMYCAKTTELIIMRPLPDCSPAI